jgi:hypothetical protein
MADGPLDPGVSLTESSFEQGFEPEAASVRCLAILQLVSALKAVLAVVLSYLWLGLAPPPPVLLPVAVYSVFVIFCVTAAIGAGWCFSRPGDGCWGGTTLLIAASMLGVGVIMISRYPAAPGAALAWLACAALPPACAVAFATFAASMRRFVSAFSPERSRTK